LGLRLSDVLKQFPGVELADSSHNQEILDFFDQSKMEGNGLELSYQRAPDFFSFLNFHSPDHFVLLFKHSGRVIGVGTLVIRPGIINGEKKMVGYWGDLRVGFNRRLSYLWRKVYGFLIRNGKNIIEFHGCDDYYTAVMDDNYNAIKNLLNNPKNGFRYDKLYRYQMVNLFMRKPFKKTVADSNLRIRVANAKDIKHIKKFMQEQSNSSVFGYCFDHTHDELDFRLSNWSNLSFESMIIVLRGDSIVGFTQLWSPRVAKKMIVSSLPMGLSWIVKFLSVFTTLPNLGEEFRVLYMTMLSLSNRLNKVERLLVMQQLIDFSMKHQLREGFHSLAFTYYYQLDDFSKVIDNYYSNSTGLTLYSVKPDDQQQMLIPKTWPGFEMALV
jgi:hypothetical protein